MRQSLSRGRRQISSGTSRKGTIYNHMATVCGLECPIWGIHHGNFQVTHWIQIFGLILLAILHISPCLKGINPHWTSVEKHLKVPWKHPKRPHRFPLATQELKNRCSFSQIAFVKPLLIWDVDNSGSTFRIVEGPCFTLKIYACTFSVVLTRDPFKISTSSNCFKY